MSFNKKIFLILIVCIFGSCFFFLPSQTSLVFSQENNQSSNSPKSTFEDRLVKQLRILRSQNLLGRGKNIQRRYKKIKQKADSSFEKGDFEVSSILYYIIVENPEFEKIIPTDEMEYRLIQSLYHSNEDFAALDYVKGALKKGPKSPYFIKVFRILVDILNRVRDWNEIDPILQDLQKKSKKLPAVIREEANYLFGRMAYFKNDLEQAKVIFSSISPNSRFYSRAMYHLGVIAAKEKDYSLSMKRFEKALEISKNPTDFKISDAKEDKGKVEKQRQMFRYLTLLALARVNYTRGKDARFLRIPKNTPYYPTALFENGWETFRRKQYKDTLQIILNFKKTYPQNHLFAESLLFEGYANIELGRLNLADDQF